MSAPAEPVVPSPSGPSDHNVVEQGKFWIYIQIAMLLAVITGLELVTVYLPFLKWLLVTVLVVLSTVKFMFVSILLWALEGNDGYHIHLNDDGSIKSSDQTAPAAHH